MSEEFHVDTSGAGYRKAMAAPIVVKPCEQAILRERRVMRATYVTVIHGDTTGDVRITEHKVGSAIQ